MSHDALDDNVSFATPAPEGDRAALSIRRSIASVETSLTEFEKITAGLEVLRKEHPIDLVFDVTTTKGMAEAVAHRAAWRDPRITVEKFRKAAKAPVLTLGKDIDARAAWLTEQLLQGETPVHEQIKAEEARKEAEKQARINAEAGRVIAIQEALAEISMAAIVAGRSSAEIAARLDAMRATPLDPLVYQEMMPQAQEARIAAIAKMEQGLKAAQWDEAEAARKAAEAEAQRIKQAAEDVERARVSAEQRAEAQRLQEARDMIAKAEKEAAEKIAAERAELDRQRQEFAAAQRRAAEERMARAYDAANKRVGADLPYEAYLRFAGNHGEKVPLEMVDDYIAALNALQAVETTEARDSQQVLKAESATPDATDRDAPANTSPSVGSMGAGQPADAGATEEPTLTLGDIKERIAPLSITAEGLAQFGFAHAATKGAAKLYQPSAWPAMRAAMVKALEAA